MTCPTCRAKVTRDPARPSKLFPFCSERCHLVDLGRWLGEEYRVPGPTAADGGEGVPAPAPPADD
ncbi:MAG TPA: DNA gyrase inhibitor YacG [Kofleriaceae bacterium]|nr:DNA gyrase inhibitor YacG [Kofleriaceae bacterium]